MYAPEHEEQPVQSVHVHFNAHVWTFDAHQLLHTVVLPVEQKEHPAQRGQVHFIAHGLDLRAHQLSHSVASHFGSTLVDPTVLVNLPGGHFFWAMHLSLGQPSHHTNERKDVTVQITLLWDLHEDRSLMIDGKVYNAMRNCYVHTP